MKTKVPEGLELVNELPADGVVVAKTCFKEAVYKSGSIEINGKLYSTNVEDNYKSIGYVKINDNDYAEVFQKKSNMLLIIILVLLILVLLAVLFFLLCESKEEPKAETENSLVIADGKDNSSIPEKPPTDYTEYIELPYLSTLDVSDDYNLVALQNPENNTVYMRFSVDYNGEKIFSNDEVVAPGKYIEWHPKDYFKDKGVYDVNIYIETFDINDQSSCSGANIASKLTVR